MKITDTLSGKKEEFQPQGDVVTMYVCGVTPYDDAHLGHAMSYIIFDVITRYLKYRGYKVRFVQNVTDIDDKIIERANQRGVPTRELAEKFTASYVEDMKSLNIEPPDKNPYATDVIPDMIEMIQGLVDKGYAYPAGGSVYFRVRNVPDYGKLSKRSLDSMRSGTTCEIGGEKEDPLDFVLWKAAKPGEPEWDSPWGKGRPGWHIECSTMSLKYLGQTIDIHGGGQDLVFPHHENEIAQSESFTGKKPFAKYWLHNGLVQLGADKMSKSLGNLITIREALQKYGADAIRIFILSSYYRSPLTYTEEALEAAAEGAERLITAVRKNDETSGKGEILDSKSYADKFTEAMDDDFNTPQALAVLFDLSRKINEAVDEGISVVNAQNTLVSLARIVLGLRIPRVFNVEVSDRILMRDTVEATVIPGKLIPPKRIPDAVKARVNRLLEERANCRKEKNWQRADEIREKLAQLGVSQEDSKTRTTITYKSVPSQKSLDNLMKELGVNL